MGYNQLWRRPLWSLPPEKRDHIQGVDDMDKGRKFHTSTAYFDLL